SPPSTRPPAFRGSVAATRRAADASAPASAVLGSMPPGTSPSPLTVLQWPTTPGLGALPGCYDTARHKRTCAFCAAFGAIAGSDTLDGLQTKRAVRNPLGVMVYAAASASAGRVGPEA